MEKIKKRLEYLRQELKSECISYGELMELKSLKKYIDSGDVELLEAAGVPENKEKRYNILSPDGFEMFFDTDYATPEAAEQGFNQWKMRYVSQGFYSSNNGRIPINELRINCKLIEV